MSTPLRKVALLALVAVAAVAGCLAACASFSDTTDPAAGSDATTGADAATDAAASADASPDAPLEAASNDAGFCEGTSWVCDQFDHPPATWPKPEWDDPETTVSPGASVSLTTEASVSAPGAASAATPANAGPVNAQLRRAHVGTFRAFRCTFQVNFKETGAGGMELFAVRVAAGGDPNFYRVGLLVGPGGGYLYENEQTSPVVGLPADMWHSIVLDVELGVGARLTIDNTPAVDPDAGSPSGIGTFTPTGAAITVGLAYSSNVTSAWRALFDDVRCDGH